MMNEEMEIDLLDLIKKCLKKWPVILACMLAFAVVVPGLQYFRMSRSYEAQKAEIMSAATDDEEESDLPVLTLSQQEDVDRAIKNYELNIEDENYISESIRLSLNYKAVDTVAIQFYIKANENVGDLKDAYISFINNSGYIEKVMESITWEDEPQYISELVNITFPGSNLSTSSTFEQAITGAYFYVNVKAPDREKAEEVAAVIKEALEEEATVLDETIQKHKLTYLGDNYFQDVDDEIREDLATIRERINNRQSTIANLENSFDDDQKEVWEAYLEDQEVIEATESGDALSQNQKAQISALEEPAFSKKFVVLGAIVGIFLAVLALTFFYVIGGKIHTTGEVAGQLKLSVLYAFTRKDRYQVDKAIFLSRLRVLCEKQGITEVDFVSTIEMDGERMQLLEEIMSEAASFGVAMHVGSSILTNPDAVTSAGNSGNVIFAETLEKSRRSDIVDSVGIMGELGIRILGAVTFE
ncbi:MAG: hypothetical protein K5840_06230 [Eubacterium sp.]|nr:hypothetical protein [Eubacterium sp.]